MCDISDKRVNFLEWIYEMYKKMLQKNFFIFLQHFLLLKSITIRKRKTKKKRKLFFEQKSNRDEI